MRLSKGNRLFSAAILALLAVILVFGLSVNVAKADSTDKVMLGGIPIGISVSTDGIVVLETSDVITNQGKFNPTGGQFRRGDIITEIDGARIRSLTELVKAVTEKECTIKAVRNGEEFTAKCKPAKDALSGDYKLGIYIKEHVSGIGTLTFVTANGYYGALGHRINDMESGLSFEFQKGNIYSATVSGSIKGQKGKAGELIGRFAKSETIGTVEKNTPYGIYGKINGYKGKWINVANQSEIKQGKAQIYTNVDGESDYYDIEIVKAFSQNSMQEKSMIIKVTDNRLTAKTGGIVQGMSGSPIIQNNKIVGAVTHVFTGDPTKGYGIYYSWMAENSKKFYTTFNALNVA
ncbi:MAG: SpoIVB peptidase [Christensenellales bacterium]